ncbi:hypothetical protein [Acetobacter estunensis]|uniref:hypothetical protein n=1 Tax=Acetobacter estunensis TaxID=104097 RepID=UPI001C2D0411|nr:hypothetical protein [Acetobacter estunensis]MBV1837594.1 hypothetical protein [Acetobacter estunensis]
MTGESGFALPPIDPEVEKAFLERRLLGLLREVEGLNGHARGLEEQMARLERELRAARAALEEERARPLVITLLRRMRRRAGRVVGRLRAG